MKTATMIDGRPFITSIITCTGRGAARPGVLAEEERDQDPDRHRDQGGDADDDPGADEGRADAFGSPLVMKSQLIAFDAVTDDGDDHDHQHRDRGERGGDGERLDEDG